MKAEFVCDECCKVITRGEKVFYRKGYLQNEEFCSSECLKNYVLSNVEIRIFIAGVDEK